MLVAMLEEIRQGLSGLDLTKQIEEGFVAYSEGKAEVPPVGELLFDDPPGEVHIKYGYLHSGPYYVIKVASGFQLNPGIGLPPGNGLMLVFSRSTGELLRVLLDEGYLTDVRTAVAGAIAAKYLAPKNIGRIGVLGTGVQARFQLTHLKPVTACRKVLAWGRGTDRLAEYRREMEAEGFEVETTQDIREVAGRCNLIVTATAARTPLVPADAVQQGTHITAMGSDTAEKQELEAALLSRADIVVADSIAQCQVRGEIAHALKQGLLELERVTELGDVIRGHRPGRTSEGQITVADLTGVAVQDIAIARAVHEALPS